MVRRFMSPDGDADSMRNDEVVSGKRWDFATPRETEPEAYVVGMLDQTAVTPDPLFLKGS